MKALVTGAAGFIGSAISRRLTSQGHTVIGVDALTDYYDPAMKMRNLNSVGGDFTFTAQDLSTCDLEPLLEDVDYVFHQAGQPGVRKSWGSDFSIYTRANVEVTQRLLEAARNHPNIQRFVYASSSSVYGNAQLYPTSESDLPQPVSPYGVTKLAAEHLCSLYASNFGVPTVSLRYFTVYGPGQRPDMAFTRFLKACATNGEIELYGDGTQIRDFTYVDDIVDANVAAALTAVNPGSVFNVAGGTNISVNEIFALIEEISSTSLNIVRKPAVAGDVFQTGGDVTAVHAALGWSASVSIRDGISRQLDWIKTELGLASRSI